MTGDDSKQGSAAQGRRGSPGIIERVLGPLVILGTPILGADIFFLSRLSMLGLAWPERAFASAAFFWLGVSMSDVWWHGRRLASAHPGPCERALQSIFAALHRLERAFYPYAPWVAVPALGLWLALAVKAAFGGLTIYDLPLLSLRLFYVSVPAYVWIKWRHWERGTGWASANPKPDTFGDRVMTWRSTLVVLGLFALPFVAFAGWLLYLIWRYNLWARY